MTEDHFAGDVAARYDDSDDAEFSPEVVARTVDRLVELAAGGPVLELAIGTGRIAIPLHQRGVEVSGVDLSTDMIAQLRSKPSSDGITTVVGDMTETRIESRGFTLAYLVFNTIGNLTTQDAQVACFRNAARHLVTGGRFLVETGVPNLQRLPRGERFVPFEVTATHIGFDEYDVATQAMWSHHYHPTSGRPGRVIPFRYVWPAELDLMARLAGLRLEHRWSGWDHEPFTAESTKHVSVWQKVSDTAL